MATTYSGGLSQPSALAFDPSGNLYVANSTGTTVSQLCRGPPPPPRRIRGFQTQLLYCSTPRATCTSLTAAAAHNKFAGKRHGQRNISGFSGPNVLVASPVQSVWPAASPDVVAVGGTALQSSETGWTNSGGGYSLYEPRPVFQGSVSGELASTPDTRAMPDVSMNAGTGQWVYDFDANSTSNAWAGIGGTSIAAPEFAGLVADTNALRLSNYGFSTTLSRPYSGSTGPLR